MFGISLILILAVMGGAIAFLGDKLGSKIGKKRLSIFGLRPHYTSILMTIITGIAVAAVTMGALTLASKDVRTALFGMNKLQSELKTLNEDKERITKELEGQNAKIKELAEQISTSQQELDEANKEKAAVEAQLASVQGELASAQAKYDEAQGKVASLEGTRDKLQGEVGDLTEATKKLREGLVAIREGDVVFRSGEILYAGVLKAGLNPEENKEQMNSFLAVANERVLDKVNAKENTQILWVSKDAVDNALNALAKGKGNIYVRICAAGNILSGEMAVSRIEMVPNNTVYKDGDIILTDNITVDPNTPQVDAALMAFLKEVNKNAVQAGVVPDPITGKVGAIEGTEVEAVIKKIRDLGGKVSISAKAKGNIDVSGPVFLKVDVKAHE